MNLKYIVK